MSPPPELPSGTVTFLFTDIEGSTRLLKQLRDGYARVLAEHQDLLRTAFAADGGQVVDTQGDAFFVVFRRAKDAVGAAAAGQQALVAHSWPDGVELRVRMGVHTGQAEASGGRYHGLAVHRASRIGDAAHGGQVLVSQTARDLLDDEEEESEGIELRDLGEQRLKDLDRPVRLYQLVVDGLPAEFPLLRTVTPPTGETAAVASAPARRRRWRLVALVGVAVVGGAVAAGFLLNRGSGGAAQASTAVAADSVGVFDASNGKPVAQAPVRTGPSSVAAGDGAVWVTNANDSSVSRIDPRTNASAETIPVGNGPSGIAVGGRFVWVVNALDGTVSQIDAGTNKVVQTVPVGNGPEAIAYGEGAVWVANSGDRTVARLDPRSGAPGRPIAAGTGADGIAVGFGALWVTSQSAGTVTRIDPHSGSLQPINVGNGPTAVAVGAGSVWVANSLDGTVSRIDPASNRQTFLFTVGAGPAGIAAQTDTVWVSSEQGGTLSRIDPSKNTVAQTLETRNRPEGVALSAGTMYVAVRSSGLAHRGGTLTVAVQDKIGSKAYNLDLARGDWDLTWLTNDGLTGYKRVGAGQGYRLVADLATSLPTPSDGGRTYTFQVRPDIRYSTGQIVGPADFRRAIERVLADPKAYGGGYYAGIRGAASCLKSHPARCDLSRGIVVDDAANTVTFHLIAPDPDFLYELAVPSAQAVPASTSIKATLPLPATGPYMFSSFDAKRGIVRLVRNPRFHEWSPAAQPNGFPDVIVKKYGYTQEGALRAVQRGAADLTGVDASNISAARLAALRIRSAGQLHQTPQLSTVLYWLHTREPPFNDVKVRRAVSYAVDRNRTFALRNGVAQRTCQMLPPNMFGYRPYCPYTTNPSGGTYNGPDLAKATQLVAASGTKGTRVVVWTIKGFWEGPPRYLVSVLNSLGYKASLKAVDGNGNAFSAVADSRQHVQADGPFPWLADYPSPFNFLTPFLTCASYVPRSPSNSNWGQFCNHRVDALIARARSLQTIDPQQAAQLLSEADRIIVNQAPVIPIMNLQRLQFVSQRVRNYTTEPLGYSALLDQLWVK